MSPDCICPGTGELWDSCAGLGRGATNVSGLDEERVTEGGWLLLGGMRPPPHVLSAPARGTAVWLRSRDRAEVRHGVCVCP